MDPVHEQAQLNIPDYTETANRLIDSARAKLVIAEEAYDRLIDGDQSLALYNGVKPDPANAAELAKFNSLICKLDADQKLLSENLVEAENQMTQAHRILSDRPPQNNLDDPNTRYDRKQRSSWELLRPRAEGLRNQATALIRIINIEISKFSKRGDAINVNFCNSV